jgi:hypothetical protein
MTDQTKDFAVKITVKNNRIIRAMINAGVKSFSELARLSMTAPTEIGKIVSFKDTPIRNGEWREIAYSISSALHCEPEDLWPDHIKNLQSKKGYVQLTMDQAEIESLGAPQQREIDKPALMKLLNSVNEMEAIAIVEHLAYGETAATVGSKLGMNGQGVTGRRATKIVAKGLRKIKHPSKLKGRKFDDFVL